jgi:hypothetical protein
MQTRTEHFKEPLAYLYGLGQLRRQGLTPRGLLFLALDPQGGVHLGVPEDLDEVTRIRVGEKMALAWPHEGRYYHFDSVHRLRDNFYVYNGDRRLAHAGSAREVAGLTADFLKASSARNVFFSCTPHQPGSWLVGGTDTVALHEAGYCEVVPVAHGLLARRAVDDRLWLHTFAALVERGRLDQWQPVYTAPLGNVLMLERRIIGDRLVLSCERGLVEVDVAGLPSVREVARVPMQIGFGVVGRVEGAAFAVTQGKPEPWGLDEIRPAVLIGAEGGTLAALGKALAEAARK